MSETGIAVTNAGCLLVVDDQESNIQVMGAALGQLGFEILHLCLADVRGVIEHRQE